MRASRLLLALALLAPAPFAAAAQDAASSQLPATAASRRDLVPAGARAYGVEIRAEAGAECRVGAETASAAAAVRPCQWSAPTPFSIAWTAGEVRLTVGGTTVRQPGPWKVGNAIHVSARGSARIAITRVADEWTNAVADGDPASGHPADAWISREHLRRGWTISGTLERRAPGADDAIAITVGDDAGAPDSGPRPLAFTGGISGPRGGDLRVPATAGVPRTAPAPRGVPTRTWKAQGTGQPWSNAANWTPNDSAPVSGDQLVFGQDGQNGKEMLNDLPNLVVGGITVQQSGYIIRGNGLTLSSTGTSTISDVFRVPSLAGGGSVTFRQLFLEQQTSTTFAGSLSGDELFLEKGGGTFTYTGPGNVRRTELRAGGLVLDGGSLGETFVNGGVFGADGADGGTANGNFTFNNGTYIQSISSLTDFHRLSVNGYVTVNGTLNVRLQNGYVPNVGDKFLIINNDGGDSVTNLFGQQEGGTVTSGSVKFTISARGGDGNDVVLTVTDSGVPVNPANLTVIKSHAPGTFTAGGQGTYTLTVTNAGDGATSGLVTLTDTMPQPFRAVSIAGTGWNCILATLVCTRSDVLAAGQSYPPVQIAVQVAEDATTSINVAEVNGGGDPSGGRADDPTPVARAVDLSIGKAHLQSFVQGSDGTYIVTVTNQGAAPTSADIVVTDQLPPGLTAKSASGDGWNCLGTQTIECIRKGPLEAHARSEITLVVAVSPTAPSTVVNTASVSSAEDTNGANNSATIQTPVQAVSPELVGHKQQDGLLRPGQSGTLTLTIENAGNGATSAPVVVEDQLPERFTPTAASGLGWDCTVNAPLVRCTRDSSLAAGESATITITVSVAPDAQNSRNLAIVSGGGDLTPDEFESPLTVTRAATDLTIRKSHAGSPVQGGTVTFDIEVGNAGETPSSGEIVVTDSLPQGLTFVSADGDGWNCLAAASSVTCRRDDSLAGEVSFPFIAVTARIGSDVTSVTNTATVSGGGDADDRNNTASDEVIVGAVSPDLTITKTHEGSFTPGQSDARFTLTVRNVGAAPTGGEVVVTDSPPGGLTLTSGSGAGWSCALSGPELRCSRADALPPESAYPSIAVLASLASNATGQVNEATVTGGGDASPANNVARDAYTVAGAPRLVIRKSHAGVFVQGQSGSYELAVQNVGTGPTTAPITLSDPLPAGLVPTAAAGEGWTCQIQGQQVTCVRTAPMASQEVSIVTITVIVSAAATSVTNIATVSGGGDPTAAERPAADPTTIVGTSQLTITKSHPGPVLQGQQGLLFAIGVRNNGSAATSGAVTVTDPLPEGLQPVDASGSGWSCGIQGTTVTCSRVDPLAAGEFYDPIHVAVDVAPAATSVTNIATVNGGGDTTPDDNSASDLVAISSPGSPNLVMFKQHDGNFTQGQVGALYRLRVENRGPAPSSGEVTVVDDLPDGLRPTSAAGGGWNCGIAGSRVSCTRGDVLPPGGAWPPIEIAVDVVATASTVVNTATLSGGGDGTAADNTASDPTTIGPNTISPVFPDLRLVKRHQDPFVSGQVGAAYRLTVTNAGTGPTVGEVTVTDTLPPGMTPTSAGGAGWLCAVAAPVVTCRRSDALAPGNSYPDIELLVNVLPTASSVANVATVSGGGEQALGNNSATDFTNVNGSVDAEIAMGLASALVVGTTAEYVVQVRSLGPGTIGGETLVTAALPDALIPLAGSGTGWQCQSSGQQIRCIQPGLFTPGSTMPELRLQVLVRTTAASVTTTAVVDAPGDANDANDRAEVTSSSTSPTAALRIRKTAGTDRVTIGGSLTYRVEVANIGDARVAQAVLRDLLPRGFQFVDAASDLQSTTRSLRSVRPAVDQPQLEWTLGTLSPGETVTLSYRVVVGAEARAGRQDNRATVSGAGPGGDAVVAGPAIASVEVVADTFSLLQAVVGRVYEDLDGNGVFTSADRPIAGARVITSAGQASITDPDGLYNIPSLGAGSVALSLDRSTIPGHVTVTDDGPGARSWTRLLRTPVGGGTVLRQNFALTPAAGKGMQPEPASAPAAPAIESAPPETSLAAPPAALPPRREYQSRDGASLLIALGEVSFGQAAPEFEVFNRSGDTWGYGSVFLQTPIASPRNRLTLAYDTHRRLNGTTGEARLFELDPNDRLYPVFGDTSIRQEFATANSKFFGRLERGASYVMYGDLIGDLPSSASDGGRWSTYQRHLTGTEVRVANTRGAGVVVRGAQPTTAYARDVFSGSLLGLLPLTHSHVRAGTETIAVEVRDRRLPERVLSRDVLARAVDYELEPVTGAVFLRRHIGGLDSALNLVQVVATYEYENTGIENMVYSGRGWWGFKGLRVGGTYFSEDGAADDRFQVVGLDLEQRLPRGGSLKVDLPYSHGSPDVSRSVDTRPSADPGRADGLGLQATVEQPFAFWSGRASGSFLGADRQFQNPFSSTITPGARYAAGGVELSPRQPSRIKFAAADERYTSSTVDAQRTTVSGSWAETIGGRLTLTGGYDQRWLDRRGADTESGLVTAAARLTIGDRLEASAAREQNVLDDDDPTYPDQTTLGARVKLWKDASAFYTHRISDSPIVPVGDFTGTGLSALPTTSELSVGVESRVAEATQVTSRYQIDQGISGADAFAVIGVATQLELGRGFAGTFGGERAELVSGSGDDYTSGTVGISYLGSKRFKATARYEARDREGFASLLTTGLATRITGGITGLFRTEWLNSHRDVAAGQDSLSFLGAVAIRPATNDRAGLLFSYQYVDRDEPVQSFGQPRDALAWRQRLSADGYVQPVRRLDLHGKVAWLQASDPQQFVGTYLVQGRAQMMLHRFVDAGIEGRYIRQEFTATTRHGTAAEIGFWPLADLRAAFGYSFDDSRDPEGRDREGRARGVYVTLSTKLSRLFNLLGSAPPAAASANRR